jgi:molybdopterin biosynthesis enzyme MoaB
MKKLIIIFFLTTFPLFGQNKEFRKATNFYNSEQFYQANFILEKLLNKEYGDLDEKMEFQILYMNAGCVFSFNEYNKALLKYNELIDFVKKSKNIFPNISDKEKSIVDIEKLITNTKLKIPSLIDSLSISNKTLESSSEIKTLSDENEIRETPIEATDNKTVTLTVSGTGKTIEDAKLNALRSAIEQAFGAFISSKTEILNDQLIKDEIVSVANGNVQKYNLVSQAEVPNIGYAITLSATVSISKLTSFAESKGVVVEFKGGMFGLKIKLQRLNEDSEFIAVKNLLSQTFEMLENSIDYSINVTEPKLVTNNLYSLGIEVIEKKNINYDNCMNYLIKTLNNLSLNDNDANEITKNGKDLCYLWIDGQFLRFRNDKSINALFNFSVICSMLASNCTRGLQCQHFYWQRML